MAAITPDTHYIENAGSKVLHICAFSNAAHDGDTWASGINGIVGYWGNKTGDPTQTKEGIDISLSSTTFTFNLGENDKAFTLYVLSNA